MPLPPLPFSLVAASTSRDLPPLQLNQVEINALLSVASAEAEGGIVRYEELTVFAYNLLVYLRENEALE